MAVTSIICEFNPIHMGHEKLLRSAKTDNDTVVCIMSGNFTQRSECAVYDKYLRAEAAASCGADLVLELPFPFSSAGAEFFAKGGVKIASLIGSDCILFGSECGRTEMIKEFSELSESEEFRNKVRSREVKQSGIAKAIMDTYEEYGFNPGPNDRLGAEYIKSSKELNCDFEFRTIKRDDGFSSSSIRESICSGAFSSVIPLIPESAYKLYKEEKPVNPDNLEKLEKLYFRHFFIEEDCFFEADGGLMGRIVSSAKKSGENGGLYELASTKKYTMSRIRRAALFGMLGVRKKDLDPNKIFTVVLSADRKGRELLKKMKANNFPVLTKPSDNENTDSRLYSLWSRADDIYQTCKNVNSPSGEYLKRSPVIID